MHYKYLCKKDVFDSVDLEQKIVKDANFTKQNSGRDTKFE